MRVRVHFEVADAHDQLGEDHDLREAANQHGPAHLREDRFLPLEVMVDPEGVLVDSEREESSLLDSRLLASEQ